MCLKEGRFPNRPLKQNRRFVNRRSLKLFDSGGRPSSSAIQLRENFRIAHVGPVARQFERLHFVSG